MSTGDVEIGQIAASKLMGFMLSFVGDTVGMIRFSFSRPGREGEWRLHIQCSWRLSVEGSLVTGDGDWSEHADPDGPDDEGWDPAHGGSLQELRLRQVLTRYGANEQLEMSPNDALGVNSVTFNGFGDLDIGFGGGLRLQAFPTSSRGEAWRLFDAQATGPGFVWPPEREDQ